MNTDDEINLSEILTLISSERSFHKYYRDIALNWIQEIVKPSRRFKKITPEDLIISAKGVVAKKLTVTRSNNEDNIFADEDEEEEDDEGSEQKMRLDDAKKDELLKRLCSFC